MSLLFKNLVGFLILLLLQGCTGSSSNSGMQNDSAEKLSSGFSIQNGSRRGSTYVDSNGTTFVYYYITTTITNDSTLPMNLTINFSKKKNLTNDTLKSPVFMLPRKTLRQENPLPVETPQIDLGMSKELKWFLGNVAQIPVSLDTVLNPNGVCVLTFGILNNVTYAEPYGIGLKVSPEVSTTPTLVLSFDRIPDEHYLIPCGEISFTQD